MEKQGVFYAVSVGPGDPELLTRQACRVLEACDIIAAPRMKSGRMLALDIAGRRGRYAGQDHFAAGFYHGAK